MDRTIIAAVVYLNAFILMIVIACARQSDIEAKRKKDAAIIHDNTNPPCYEYKTYDDDSPCILTKNNKLEEYE